MDRRERHAEVERMCQWWDSEVGERPDNLESMLGGFLKDMSPKAVWTALDIAARNESLEDSEDVLENVRNRIRRWRNANAQRPRLPRGLYRGLE